MRSPNPFMKYFLLFIIFCAAAGSAGAQAKVLKVSGKVEIKAPKGAWAPARAGMAVTAGSMVATGFRSSAQLELNRSTLFVKQLTRLSLEEIAERQNVVTTNLFIRTGSLEAEVKSGADYKHDFKVRSAVSTAAVKGTKIKYDGNELSVLEGKAELFNSLGQRVTVFQDDSALTAAGFDLLDSKTLKGIIYKLKLALRTLGKKSESISDFRYLSDYVNIIFTFDFPG